MNRTSWNIVGALCIAVVFFITGIAYMVMGGSVPTFALQLIGHPRMPLVGQVLSIDGNMFVLGMADGSQKRFTIDPNATFERPFAPELLTRGDLQVGKEVSVFAHGDAARQIDFPPLAPPPPLMASSSAAY